MADRRWAFTLVALAVLGSAALQAESPIGPGRRAADGDPGMMPFHRKAVGVRLGPGTVTQGIKGILKDDFLVNDDTLGYCDHAVGFNSAARLADGNFVVAYEAYSREWAEDVWCQILDSAGSQVGPPILVNETTLGDAIAPAVAALGQGFVVAWSDWRTGDGVIWARLYGPGGTPAGENFQVSPGTGQVDRPALAANDSGFVVAWQDDRFGSNICARWYAADGTPRDTSIVVSTTYGTTRQEPAVGMNDSVVLIAWQNTISGYWEVYAQLYTARGAAIDSNFRVNDSIDYIQFFRPAVACNDSMAVVAWEDHRNGNGDIYARFYSLSGDTLGSSFRLGADAGTADQLMPCVAMDDSLIAFAWLDWRIQPYYVFAQFFTVDGESLGTSLQVSDTTLDDNRPGIALGPGGALAVWYDDRFVREFAFGQRFDRQGYAVGGNFIVPGDDGSAYQTEAQCAANGQWLLAVWVDYRNRDPDIYGQWFDNQGVPVGPNFRINDDGPGNDQYDMQIAMNDSLAVVVWYEYRPGSGDIYAQVLACGGGPVGGNFQVDNPSYQVSAPAVAVNDSFYIIAWNDYRFTNGRVFSRAYRTDGSWAGTEFRVDQSNIATYEPSVAMNDSVAYIAWKDYRHGWSYPAVYGRRLACHGDTLPGEIKLSDGYNSSYTPSVSASDSQFVVAWCDYRTGGPNVYAQRVAVDGDTVGSNFKVNDNSGTVQLYDVSTAYSPDGSKFLVSWTDDRYQPDNYNIMVQAYDASGTPLGANVLVNREQGWWQQQPEQNRALACTDDRIFFVWEDDRRYHGGDIYAKLTDWDLAHIESTPPVISYIDSLPDDPEAPYGPYTVKAVVTDDRALWYAQLVFRVDGGTPDTLDMSPGAADTFAAEMPELAVGLDESKLVEFWVQAADSSFNRTTSASRSFLAIGPIGVTGDPSSSLPKAFALEPAAPNPSRGRTAFAYQLPRPCPVSFEIFNIAGQQVERFDLGLKQAGRHRLEWKPLQTPSGVYIYRLKAGDFSATRKLLLIK